MVRFDTPDGTEERFRQRQCWLGMQAAYRKYRQAAALAHSLADDLSNDPTSSDKAIQLQMATHGQRTAFEGYIEARLQFLESSYDRNHHTTEPGGLTTKRFMCVVGAITIGVSALNILSLSWERRQIADLHTIKRETNERVSEGHQSLTVLSKRVTPNLAASRIPGAGGSEAPGASKCSLPPSGSPRRPIAHLVRAGRYAYSDFAVVVSPRFTRIGPIRISVRSVDPRTQKVSLCVASGTAVFCKNDVSPYEWLSIRLGDPIPSIELLVTRVGSGRVQGYFRTPGNWSALKVNSLQSH